MGGKPTLAVALTGDVCRATTRAQLRSSNVGEHPLVDRPVGVLCRADLDAGGAVDQGHGSGHRFGLDFRLDVGSDGSPRGARRAHSRFSKKAAD